MKYYRTYLQYNDLVFDYYDMISEYDATQTSFKQETQSYSYGDGSYATFKRPYLYVEEGSVSMTIYLHMKKLTDDLRRFYRDFAMEQLSMPGKLWAVQDNTLVWAYAFVQNISETTSRVSNQLELDLDFVLYEGVWHKADKQMTFLKEYDVNTYLDECYSYQTYSPCEESSTTVTASSDSGDCCTTCLTCNTVYKEEALCYYDDVLQTVYGRNCGGFGYRILYDCVKGLEFFGKPYLGTKFSVRGSCSSTVAGVIYSDTTRPTTGVTITLVGVMHNPYVEINGNGNWIKGDYNGVLTINPNGDVYYSQGGCTAELLDPSVWQIPTGMEYGWTVKPRNNRLVADFGASGGSIYVQVDALTI